VSAAAPPPGWRLRVEESLASTSDLLLRLAAAGEPGGLAVLARRQTAGRGRDGRAWSSPPGNLYLSVLLRPGGLARDAGNYALLAAVALAEALEPELSDPTALGLKWPNDLLLGGAKLAGVLCETSAGQDGTIEWLVMGLGANLAVAPDLPDRPTACLPAPVAPETVALRVLRALDAWRGRMAGEGLGPLVDAWMRRGPEAGARLTLRGGAAVTTGLYRGLDRDGALLLETDGRIRRFASGEIAG
jgi:BirA family biotin operon repressor/biotin-[acetyl-CoA-carboxylase] ligase